MAAAAAGAAASNLFLKNGTIQASFCFLFFVTISIIQMVFLGFEPGAAGR